MHPREPKAWEECKVRPKTKREPPSAYDVGSITRLINAKGTMAEKASWAKILAFHYLIKVTKNETP